MKQNERFPSRFLRAEDLQGDTNFTIEAVTPEVIGSGKDAKNAFVLHFADSDKILVLNKTNDIAISKALGTGDDEKWIGKTITLYPTEVEFKGETVLGVRVRLRSALAPSSLQQSAVDEVPF